MHITLRPNAYVICAVLAGMLAGGWPGNPLELVALWVLADLAMGAWHTGLVSGAAFLPWARGERRLAPEEWVGAAGGAALAVLIAGSLGEQAGYLTRAALGLGVVIALAGARQPRAEAAPVLTGLQVLLAWTLGLTRGASALGPWLALGLVAAIGVWCRLRRGMAPSPGARWVSRLAWGFWVVILLAVRQPLLAGLVSVTGLADDLGWLAPGRSALYQGLMTLGWLGTWVIAAVAVAQWSVVG